MTDTQPTQKPQDEKANAQAEAKRPSPRDSQSTGKGGWQRFVPPLLAFALVAALGTALLRPADDASASGPLVGKPAPEFTLTSLDGVPVSLSDFTGRPVVLNFWASWCGPCREEAPMFRQLSERQSAGGLAVVGILFEERDPQNARNFIAEYGLAYPNLTEERLKVALDYGVAGIPETFFIDRDGLIQHRDKGGLDKARLNVGLEKIGVEPL